MFENLKSVARRAKRELKVYGLLLKDKRTPTRSRLLLGLALLYIMSPIDLIPDFIPIVGQLDNLIIVPGLIFLALKMVPKELVEECRARAAVA